MSSDTSDMSKLTSSEPYSSLQGQFLLAMPQMLDPHFKGTLNYICEHDEHGAMGITINRPGQFTLCELFEQLDIPFNGDDQLIYLGGPVQQDRGFILHNDPSEWQSTLNINGHLRLTTSKDILEAIAINEGPSEYLIALGYSGWGAGQLEQELADSTWLNCPADNDILFHTQSQQKLTRTMLKMGVDPNQLNGQIGHA